MYGHINSMNISRSIIASCQEGGSLLLSVRFEITAEMKRHKLSVPKTVDAVKRAYMWVSL